MYSERSAPPTGSKYHTFTLQNTSRVNKYCKSSGMKHSYGKAPCLLVNNSSTLMLHKTNIRATTSD